MHDWWLFVLAMKMVVTATKIPNTAPASTSDPLRKSCQKSIEELLMKIYSDAYNQIFDSKMWTMLTLEIWIVENILTWMILSNTLGNEDKAERNTFIRRKIDWIFKNTHSTKYHCVKWKTWVGTWKTHSHILQNFFCCLWITASKFFYITVEVNWIFAVSSIIHYWLAHLKDFRE